MLAAAAKSPMRSTGLATALAPVPTKSKGLPPPLPGRSVCLGASDVVVDGVGWTAVGGAGLGVVTCDVSVGRPVVSEPIVDDAGASVVDDDNEVDSVVDAVPDLELEPDEVLARLRVVVLGLVVVVVVVVVESPSLPQRALTRVPIWARFSSVSLPALTESHDVCTLLWALVRFCWHSDEHVCSAKSEMRHPRIGVLYARMQLSGTEADDSIWKLERVNIVPDATPASSSAQASRTAGRVVVARLGMVVKRVCVALDAPGLGVAMASRAPPSRSRWAALPVEMCGAPGRDAA